MFHALGLVCLTAIPWALVLPPTADNCRDSLRQAKATQRPLIVVLENPRDLNQVATKLYANRQLLQRFELCRLDVNSAYGREVAAVMNATELPFAAITDAKCQSISFRSSGNFSRKHWQNTLELYSGDSSTDRPSRRPRRVVARFPVTPKSVQKPVPKPPAAKPESLVAKASSNFPRTTVHRKAVVRPSVSPSGDEMDPAGGSADQVSQPSAESPSTSSSIVPEVVPSVEELGPFHGNDLAMAQRVASQQDRRLVVYVSMDRCRYCDRMEEETLSQPSVHKALENFTTVKIQRKAHPEWVKRFGVRVYPSTLILNPHGELIQSIAGFVGPGEFCTRLRLLKLDVAEY